MDNVLLHYIF